MARITKKDIYASYGIEFDGKYITAPIFGKINPLLINGNEKLGKGVWTWSMLPTNDYFYINFGTKEKPNMLEVEGTCPCHCPGCYATKGCYNWNDTKVSNARKTVLAYTVIDWLEKAITAQIKADKIKYVRIHAAGDFFSDEYITTWKNIIKACPDTVFWTYTKYTDAENAFDAFDNANIVKSIVPGIGLNFGHCDYILNAYNTLKASGKSVYICRCGIDENQHCNNCRGCSNHDYVLFIEHSTGYVPESDAAFDELKNVIESQPRQ